MFTNNVSTQQDATALFATKLSGYDGSVTIGESIFALNEAIAGTVTPNVWVANGVTKTNEGKNLYDNAAGNFFNQVPGAGDHLGTPDYVVTTVADTFDHTDDIASLSIREAIDLANQAAGQKEVWLPAWEFQLTRDRVTYGGGSSTDTDIAFGDLDIKDQLIVRGVAGRTRVEWKPGVVDSVFDLLGDANNDGMSDQDTNAADYTVWADQDGSGSGTSADWEIYSADFDDDGDVDTADHAIWSSYYGNSLDLFDVEEG